MAYVAVVKALYDYAAQDPETELSFKEDQLLYIIEKEDEDWWKGKLKDEVGDDGPVGLIPATYVEQIPPVNTTRAIYAYASTSPEELSISEDEPLSVFSVEEDWLLVATASEPAVLGFVPRTYCEALDERAAVQVADADEGVADVEEARERERQEKLRVLKLKDKVETWSVSEMEGKKKKKGTLGVGNGAVFFASDTDKMSGVKQYAITELSLVSQPSSKNLELTFSALPQPLTFHCSSSDEASAILAKLESSKAAAGEALEMAQADDRAQALSSPEHEQDEYLQPTSHQQQEPKAVRWAETEPEAITNGGGAEYATVQYDFDAQGEDELSVKENEVVTVVDKENDEWWLVRNSSGHEGVVPAQYVTIDGPYLAGDGEGAHYEDEVDSEDERRKEEQAAASLEAERRRERERKAEERRAIERAAKVKREQEEKDRQMALELEAKEAAKAERRARRREEEAGRVREIEADRRREVARGLEPPKVARRPSAQNVAAAAASLPTRGKRMPEQPPEGNRPKPHAGRIRVWSDKSGQFKVEAEYLGMNGNKIRLHKLNGVIIEVPMEKMSPDDVAMIRRHEARRAQQRQSTAEMEEDDLPLAQTTPRRGGGGRSDETMARERRVRDEEPIPKEAMEPPKPRKPRFDWFAFFLEAGCDMDDCTRYAAAFERDRIDETLLPDLEAGTLRSLGLKEGDVIRVRKEITNKFAKKTPEQEAQIRADEDYAKQLQEHENSGGKGPAPVPPPGLFTGPNGKLANNTRRGRPERRGTGADAVDPSVLAAASDQLSKVSVTSPSPPPPPPPAAPPAAEKAPEKASLIPGFDDDAWTIKPSSSKPASPAPPPPPASNPSPPSPPPANTTESLLAQIQALRPASTGAVATNATGGSSSAFDRLAQGGQMRPPSAPIQQTGTGGSYPQVSPYGMGVQGGQQPMSAMMTGARGPVAPIAANEPLLNPLQPARTGFVPTRPGQQQQQQMMPPQQTGFMGGGMQPQMTGYAAGFQQAYGGQPQQISPQFTGYPAAGGNFGQQSPASSFNQIASMPPPQQQQPPQNADKFAPSNIFAAMKKTEFGRAEEERPQESVKYDALRPLTTGYNGAPQQPQMQQQQMYPQQTGFGGMGMGMMGGGGMMPQMTGYPGMMYMPGQQQQQQNGYGGQGYR